MSNKAPFPFEKNFVLLSVINLKEILGLASATFSTQFFIYLLSVASCFKNLYLTGVL